MLTVTFRAPAAIAASMTKVAVIDEALCTLLALTVTPAPLTATAVAPATKLAPFNVTDTVVPAVPVAGVIVTRLGALRVEPAEPEGATELLSVQPVRSIARLTTTHASHALRTIRCTGLPHTASFRRPESPGDAARVE